MLPSLGLAPNMCISYRYVCVYSYIYISTNEFTYMCVYIIQNKYVIHIYTLPSLVLWGGYD